MTNARNPGPVTEAPRSLCPIATSLEIFGDRWTLILVRDLLTGKRHYQEFLASPEGISTNILADRLKRLEAAGLVRKRPYQTKPLRHEYALTEQGMALLPVLQEVCRWANRFMPETWTPPVSFMRQRIKN